MRLKLNHEKMQGTLGLITFLLNEYPPEDKAEKLLSVLVNQVRIKLRNRLEDRNTKDSYTVTISDTEAIALDLWMSQMAVGIPEQAYVYEASVVKNITNEIDKIYG